MNHDVWYIVLGIVFGVAASIPTSLLIVAAAKGSRQSEASYWQQQQTRPNPPAVTDAEWQELPSFVVTTTAVHVIGTEYTGQDD
jgi:hypothetical protein